ncbi:MAG TPA: DUF2938 domain-containing protein [Vitreimonas sp.]|uniref:DUF2938 domain-containing protein n=1 Tax=Vitreimonas sp. TaxID=3069702 RepID=UPI002D62CD81|nr:DUF2938 domain-containing protein [Vitreimonas sp.]HYD88134.1 DUF2938 domain-containing protein [Vitreimonas sp.]
MLNAIVIGAGATAFMDLASVVRARLGAPSPDYGLVGRWLAHAARGRKSHEAIAQAAPVAGEALIGWGAHYLIGVGYAALLLLAFPGWADQPRFMPAMLIGVGTVLAPFLIMQPGMGAGFFASRTPDPSVARQRSLITHALFGLGLYCAGLARLLVFQ